MATKKGATAPKTKKADPETEREPKSYGIRCDHHPDFAPDPFSEKRLAVAAFREHEQGGPGPHKGRMDAPRW